jgi:hypothetical protein
MCNFFSFVSDGRKCYYFDWELRKKILAGDSVLKNYQPDSHSSIAAYHGFEGSKEDSLNKYEYNPILKKFVVDQINTIDDSESCERWVTKLDFTKVAPIIIKPVFHPLTGKAKKASGVEIQDLKQWASVWASVGASVRASVWDSVGDSVWDSVGASVRASVWDSVWDSVGAYTSSFFSIDYKFDYSGLNNLWNNGFVPSFDGTTWRLYSGKDAKVVWEGKI